jgi:signal peptidase II
MQSTTENLPARNRFQRLLTFLRASWRDYLLLLLVAGVLVALDQWTKSLVRTQIPLGQDWLPDWLTWLMPYARVRHWYNSGAAFGLFQQGNLIFTVLAFLVSGLILYYYPRLPREDWWLRVAMVLQFTGAIGNLIDRLRFGRVTDFISVGNFAVFNLADSCITVGVGILILGVYLKELAEKKKARLASEPGTGTDG